MTSQPGFAQPPTLAVWLVNLFTLAGDDDSILGDLLEEFSQLASSSGIARARRWFWRQSLQTIAHLVFAAYRESPWLTTAAVAGGFFLRKLLAPLPERAIFALVDRFQLFEYHFNWYRLLVSPGIDIGHVVVFWFVGCAVGLAARRREMAATMTLGLIFGAMVVFAAAWVTLAGPGDYNLWRLGWYFTDSFVLVVGGAMVRMLRSTAPPLGREV
jgi:hypothetical protein